MYEIDKLPQTIDIGYTGEHDFRQIQIDMTEWMKLIPNGIPSIVHIRPGETVSQAYKASTTFDNNILTWDIAMSDLGTMEGTGIAQVWLEDVTGLTVNHRGKSAIFATVVHNCAGEADAVPASQTNWEGQLALKVDKTSIANNLTTTEEGKVLDARQGKALDDSKVDKTSIVNNLEATEEGGVLDARQGKALDDKKVNIQTAQAQGKFLQTNEDGVAVWGDAASPTDIANAVTAWLDLNVPTGTTVVVDKSLSTDSAAADAQMTGRALKANRSSVGNIIEQLTGNKPLVFVPGYYRVYDNGTVVDISAPDATNATGVNTVCTLCPCQPGDVFYIKAYGGASTAAAFGYLDSDCKGIYRGTTNGLKEGKITIPSTASDLVPAWLIVNNKVTSNPTDYYAYKGESFYSVVNDELDHRIRYYRLLTSADDLNDFVGIGAYRFSSGSRPLNSPTAHGGTLLTIGVNAWTSQIIVNYNGTVYARFYNSPDWTEWSRLSTRDELDQVSEAIGTITSYAAITGDPEDTYVIRGITMTKKSDGEFTLAGNSSYVVGKGFNVLLGNNELITSKSAVMAKNISTPGVYTVAFKTSFQSDNDHLFAITDGTFGDRKYLKSGESFTVESDPVCLFVYGTSKLRLSSNTLTVKWALYKGEEYSGYPYVESGQLIAVDPIARNLSLNHEEDDQMNESLSWGKSNMFANAKQIMEIKWTPTADTMPSGANTFYVKGTEYTGMPYSSVRDNDKAVGTNVSIHTFMTAVHDPNSVLYTRRSLTTNAQCYYGTVCSGLCNHAYGLKLHLTNYYLGASDWFDTVPMQDIQSGDMLYISGHVAMIYNVEKDKYGRIKNVTVMEEWAPNPRLKYYSSYKSFLSGRAGYIARRYKYMSGVEYEQVPYVRCFDEDESDIVYPDIQTDHGDQAVFVVGESVNINVINERDYTSIVVKRDGTTVQTINTIEPFTISNVQKGLYTITATGTEYTSESSFFVADVNGSFDPGTGIVTFSSSNATPVLVDVYKMPMEDGKYAIACRPYVLTDEDRTAGSVNVSSLMDSLYVNAKVTFDTPYGQALWRSETHPTWTPIETE